jgi:hypothetical protein
MSGPATVTKRANRSNGERQENLTHIAMLGGRKISISAHPQVLI